MIFRLMFNSASAIKAINCINYLPINAWFDGYYALILLLLEA